MSIEYNDLESLIFQDRNARQYFNELPKDIRNQIHSCSNEIHSYEKLQDIAENLIKGNK